MGGIIISLMMLPSYDLKPESGEVVSNNVVLDYKQLKVLHTFL